MPVEPAWAALIPHRGAMRLLDEVVAHDDRHVHARTRSHQRVDNPLRDGNALRSVHLCEYGAQAMAVHGGLLARAARGAARPGMLVALRDVRLHVSRIDDLPGTLEGTADLLAAGEASQQYAFRIRHGDGVIAEGRATVILGD